jgi:hypothetical protein
MVSALADWLESDAPAVRGAARHVVAFVTAADPAPLGPDQLAAQLRGVVDLIAAVVAPVRLLDEIAEAEDGAVTEEEGEAGFLGDGGGARAAAPPADGEADGGGEEDDGEDVATIQWAGGPEVFGSLRRRLETHRRVRGEHITQASGAVGGWAGLRAIGVGLLRNCHCWRRSATCWFFSSLLIKMCP